MKKILSVLLALLISMSLVGCNKTIIKPTVVVDGYIKGIKAVVKTKAKEELEEYNLEFLADQEVVDEFLDMLSDFEYVIKEEEISDERVNIVVEFTTYDYSSMIKDFIADYIVQAFTLTLKGASQTELTSEAINIVKEKISDSKAQGKTLTTPVTIELNKVDGQWSFDISDYTNDIISAITGGLMEEMQELANYFN